MRAEDDSGTRRSAGASVTRDATGAGRRRCSAGDRVLVTTSQPLSATDVNLLRDLHTEVLRTGSVGVDVGLG